MKKIIMHVVVLQVIMGRPRLAAVVFAHLPVLPCRSAEKNLIYS